MTEERFHAKAARLLSRHPDAARLLKEGGVDLDRLQQIAASSNRTAATAALPYPTAVVAESIVQIIGRPTLFVSGNDFDLPVDEDLAARLRAAKAVIGRRLPSVGRIEVFDGSQKWPVGTAWMVADDIAITNRHVASRFAAVDGTGKPAIMKDLRGRPYKIFVDFREEHGSVDEDEIAVAEIVYISPADNVASDIALLRLTGSAKLPTPIPVLGEELEIGAWVAVVGYPQPDDRLPPEARDVEESYFGHVYGVKRLSPGRISKSSLAGVPAWLIAHDATTLGGNSGSVILDLNTGAAVGLHFRGEYKKANYGVGVTELRRVLEDLKIPMRRIVPDRPTIGAVMNFGEEEATENLDQYEGYIPKFIAPHGAGDFDLPLPSITQHAPGAVATLKTGGTELHYRNFTVVMNEERRMCYFSAVNIDGKRAFSIKGPRPGWKIDRRLDENLQIIAECYGPETEGKFSRGHMTRREDPNWGDSRDEAIVSNRHTFFVTNACPQMQPFNAGLWLSLEDYALENCDRDDMRISVFTGPIFREDDPIYFKVQVPVDFFKVIAFKHDRTKELTATGYIMSQRDVLPTFDEHVFGQFRESQVTIRHIQNLTGLSFHQLEKHDPFDDGSESIAVRSLRTPQDLFFG